MGRTRRKAPDRIDSFLGKVLRKIERSYPDESHLLWQAWPEAVGPEIARRTEVRLLRDGQLTVAVSSAPWVQQLSLMSPRLITALNKACGKELVTSLRFRLATVAPPPKPLEILPDWSGEALDDDENKLAHELAKKVSDGKISDAIERARKMSLKRKKYLRRQEAD